MYKTLMIGDPHIQVSNLKDSENLMSFIIKIAKEKEVNSITFLGDLFHTHAVKRTEVEDFWFRAFNLIQKEKIICKVLVGNHDQVGSKEKEQLINSLNVFGDTDLRTIINKPEILYNIAYIPYHSSHDEFLKAAQDLYDQGATELLIAHQTFTGAQYENGFFSEEGIDPGLIPQKQIISGHIHKSQQVGKCFYPGTPKWDTMSDANEPKGIWVFTHDQTGSYIDKEFISTEQIVTPITSYEIKEGDDLPLINSSARNYVTLEGRTVWINKIKKELKNCNIKIKPTDRSTNKINTSINIDEYLENQFNPIVGVSKQEIKDFLRNV